MENLFKVSSGSHSTSIAGAIAKSIRDEREVVLQAIGAGAVNQAVKAISIARSNCVRPRCARSSVSPYYARSPRDRGAAPRASRAGMRAAIRSSNISSCIRFRLPERFVTLRSNTRS